MNYGLGANLLFKIAQANNLMQKSENSSSNEKTGFFISNFIGQQPLIPQIESLIY